MKANITIMSGDGVGPEIIQEAVKVFQAIEAVFDHDFSINEVLFGGIAIDETGSPYPEETKNACKNSWIYHFGSGYIHKIFYISRRSISMDVSRHTLTNRTRNVQPPRSGALSGGG